MIGLSYYLIAATLCSVVICAEALDFSPSPTLPRLDFSVVRNTEEETQAKREDGFVIGGFRDDYYILIADIAIGTPPQQIQVVVDTTNGDLWVFDRNASCSMGVSSQSVATSLSCATGGSFKGKLSSTFRVNQTLGDFSLVFSNNIFACGRYVQDTFSFAGVQVPSMIFGLANSSSMYYGSLGLGLVELESSYSIVPLMSNVYPNFLMRLKSLGKIKRAVYSMYRNSSGASNGRILFGGVDHSKYSNQLQTVPFVTMNTTIRDDGVQLSVVLNSISVSSSYGSLKFGRNSFMVVPDTLSPYSLLPLGVLSSLVKAFNGKIVFSAGRVSHSIDCAYLKLNITLTFDFSGAILDIPLSSWILKQKGQCYLTPDSHPTYFVLGNDFLSHTYTVFDLESHEFSFAPSSFGDNEQIEIVESSIPSAVRAVNYSLTVLSSFSDNSNQKTGMSPAGQLQSSNTSSLGLSKAMISLILGIVTLFIL